MAKVFSNAIKKTALQYGCIVSVCYLFFYYYHTLLSQQPGYIISLNYDITSLVLISCGGVKFVFSYAYLPLVFDFLFLFFPLLLTATILYNWQHKNVVIFATVVFTAYYSIINCSVTYFSLEGYVALTAVPFLFWGNPTSFYYNKQMVRYVFLLLFVGAGVFKIINGGISNYAQLSAILATQHASYMLYNDNWLTNYYQYLIHKEWLTYTLYILSILLELCFVVGFFTTKYDKYLVYLFLFFLVSDYAFMHINYIFWLPFILTLFWSKGNSPYKLVATLKV